MLFRCGVLVLRAGMLDSDLLNSISDWCRSRPPFSQVLVEVGGVPIPGGHFGSVAECRRCLDRVTYPITLTFRDMPVYLWLARVLAAVVTPVDGDDLNLTLN